MADARVLKKRRKGAIFGSRSIAPLCLSLIAHKTVATLLGLVAESDDRGSGAASFMLAPSLNVQPSALTSFMRHAASNFSRQARSLCLFRLAAWAAGRETSSAPREKQSYTTLERYSRLIPLNGHLPPDFWRLLSRPLSNVQVLLVRGRLSRLAAVPPIMTAARDRVPRAR